MTLRKHLPSVDELLRGLEGLDGVPRALLTNVIRSVLAEQRSALKRNAAETQQSIASLVIARLERLRNSSLKRVINATGVVLHTNLGRAPLPSFEPISGYSNLEYDLGMGKRGKRDGHLAPLIEALLGKPAIVVNNNAAAVYLVLNELAQGGEVIVSRGELIEIGDGFRIPEIMVRSGALLREVGTTNRTRIDDYEHAINERTRLILRVHPSNFQIRGFTARPALGELAVLGQHRNIPVYEDLGSGCLVDLRPQGVAEPLVSESLAAGMNVVSFSCDKLLGGPQAGIIAGDAGWIERIRRNPMYRAFRVDKLITQALEVTLRHLLFENWRELPALRMIRASAAEVRQRAERVAEALADIPTRVRDDRGVIGGGSTPNESLPTAVVELIVDDARECDRRLRNGAMPVIARIEKEKIILDLRTVLADEERQLVESVRAAVVASRT